jgi:hypothetical protein
MQSLTKYLKKMLKIFNILTKYLKIMLKILKILTLFLNILPIDLVVENPLDLNFELYKPEDKYNFKIRAFI